MHRVTSFAVPLTASNFAPEVMYLTPSGSDPDLLVQAVNEISILVDTLVTGAAVVLELKVPGTTDWLNAQEVTSAGLEPLIQIANWEGARIRVRSGGTSGTQRVAAFWR